MKTLRIALAKGSLLPPALAALEAVGLDVTPLKDPGRQLKMSGGDGAEYIIARPADVPTYVESGAVDIGFVGSDILMEDRYEVFELLDLGFGRCKFVLAAKNGAADGTGATNARNSFSGRASVTVATKYPNVAAAYLERAGLQAEIVKLYGSIELAPLVGLADCIIDLMSTGRTLADNGLKVIEEVGEVSCRLIANRLSYKLKSSRINELVERLNDQNRKAD